MRSRWFQRGLLIVVLVTALAPPASAAVDQPVVDRNFNDDTWSVGLVDLRSLDLTRTNLIVNGFAGQGLQVNIPEGGFRGFGPFDRLEPAVDEAWYRYHVRLLDWNSASTGKLPGLSGLYSSSGRGCIPSTEASPGWSARGMFGIAGTRGAPPGDVPIGTYLYHLDQAGTCGDELWWDGGYLEPGRWQCIEGHVKLNTPGVNDGSFEGWLDGNRLFSKTGIAYRRATETQVGIRQMWHDVYFGGSYPTPNDLSLAMDQVEVSTTGRVGCLDPFTDDNQSLHVKALTELHARGLLYGCGYRLACPLRKLTRGEVAALYARVLELPPSSVDYFSDDNGNIFEGAINKIAAAGITVGCAPGSFCPNDDLTRAQFATMTVRAMGLPASGPDAFNDDEGHWAESAINTFADNGLTEGCGPDRFCPNRTLTREEAASFFLRVADRLQPIGQASVPQPPAFPPSGPPPVIPPDETD